MSVKIVEVDVDNEGRRLDNYLISYLKDIMIIFQRIHHV